MDRLIPFVSLIPIYDNRRQQVGEPLRVLVQTGLPPVFRLHQIDLRSVIRREFALLAQHQLLVVSRVVVDKISPRTASAATDRGCGMSAGALPDWIFYNPSNDRVMIDGIEFDREFFSFIGNDEIGSVGKIVRRENGVVTIERVPE